MQEFKVPFDDRKEMQVVWKWKFASGVVFLPTQKPFPLQSSFSLVLLVRGTQQGLKIPARVIQILEGGAPEANGMVVEYKNFSSYKKELTALVDDIKNPQWTNIRDYSPYAEAQSPIAEGIRKLNEKVQKFLRISEKRNFYEILNLNSSTSAQKIHQAFLKLYQEFNPNLYKGKLTESQMQLFEKARVRVKEICEEILEEGKKPELDLSSLPPKEKDSEKPKKGKKPIKRLRLKPKLPKTHQLNINKAKRLFEEALVSEKNGEINEAMTNIRIAIVHDPKNETYRKKLDNLAKNPDNIELQKKQEILRGREKAILKGTKLDWTDE